MEQARLVLRWRGNVDKPKQTIAIPIVQFAQGGLWYWGGIAGCRAGVSACWTTVFADAGSLCNNYLANTQD
jgi:hypothetical protein